MEFITVIRYYRLKNGNWPYNTLASIYLYLYDFKPHNRASQNLVTCEVWY